MKLTPSLLEQKIAALEQSPTDENSPFYLQVSRSLLEAMRKIDSLEKALATPIRLPSCSASPVCEIEAGYAAGVSDCRTAIRHAGYLIEGDD
ncbi:hypothetical protein J2T25_001135 [Citrobacter amalonaticus]|uniref:hypothetical protein n=1 Tax=Citrobacter amalonaticus TaxID=35703 RepID=UPI001A2E4C40|nr:hypothetical protein [Citrobacter amalonaticus]MCO4157207.1 hypothetical protein [Citrobacter amalonaticus]MCP1628223.1 hypothetical protein [Citrobacter amalonaticus]HAU5066192.1 hypothetical protein [Citrobacter amalonaticus]